VTVKRVGLQVKPIGKKRSNPSSLAVVFVTPSKAGNPVRIRLHAPGLTVKPGPSPAKTIIEVSADPQTPGCYLEKADPLRPVQ
jgi:hypothetical protein